MIVCDGCHQRVDEPDLHKCPADPAGKELYPLIFPGLLFFVMYLLSKS